MDRRTSLPQPRRSQPQPEPTQHPLSHHLTTTLHEDLYTTSRDLTTRPGAPVDVAYADTQGPAFQAAMVSAGIRVRQHLVWVKNTLVLGHSDYQWRHEPIWAGNRPLRIGL